MRHVSFTSESGTLYQSVLAPFKRHVKCIVQVLLLLMLFQVWVVVCQCNAKDFFFYLQRALVYYVLRRFYLHRALVYYVLRRFYLNRALVYYVLRRFYLYCALVNYVLRRIYLYCALVYYVLRRFYLNRALYLWSCLSFIKSKRRRCRVCPVV